MKMAVSRFQLNPFTPVPMTGCRKDIPLPWALLHTSRLITKMDKNERCEKVGIHLRHLQELLGAKVSYSSTLDYSGESTRKITLTYDYEVSESHSHC